MTALLQAIQRFFSRLAGHREPTSGAIARMRLEEFRRNQRPVWEIRPPSSECELPFGSELGTFNNAIASRAEEPSGRFKISGHRLR